MCKSYYYNHLVKVRAFDPTVEGRPVEFFPSENMSFMKTGISNQSEYLALFHSLGIDDGFEMDTLRNLMLRYVPRNNSIFTLNLII